MAYLGKRQPETSQVALLSILALGTFTTALNVTFLSPLLPAIGEVFGTSGAAAGQIAAVTPIFAAATALIFVPWLDHRSWRSWLRLEAAILALGALLSAFAPNVALLMLGRACAGIGGAFIWAICLSAASEVFPDAHRRNRAVGIIGAAGTLGAVFGLPLVAQIEGLANWRFALVSLLPLLALLILGTYRLPAGARSNVPARSFRGWADGYARVLANWQSRWLLVTVVVLSLVWFGWVIYFGSLAREALGAGATTLGLLFFAAGRAEIAANNLKPLLLRLRSPRSVSVGAMVVLALALLAVGVVPVKLWTFAAFAVVAGLASVVIYTSLCIRLLDGAPDARSGAMAM